MSGDNKKNKGIIEGDAGNPFKKKKVKIKKELRPKLMADADERVQNAIIWLIANEAFFGNILIMIKRKRDFSMPTMGVYYENGFVISYNPAYVLTLSKSHLIGVLKHEIFHLIFRHISRRNGISDFKLWNIATDLAINSILKDYVPENGVFPDMEMLAKLNLPFNKSAEFYYNILSSQEGQDACKDLLQKSNYSVKIKTDENDGQNDQQQGSGQKGDGQDQQGSQGGDNNDVEVEIGGTDVHDWEGGYKDGNGNDVPDDIVNIDVQGLLKQAYDAAANKNNIWGNTPAGIIKEIEDFIFKKSEIPWSVIFRRLVLYAKKVFNVHTRQKRNRKYGYVFPGSKVREKINVVAIFDTSGSVSDIEYMTCANELKDMVKGLDSLNIIHCDTDVYDMGKFNENSTKPPPRKGYGGTEFEEPIRYAEKNYKPDVIVYLTDGYASFDFKPSKIPMVWVVTNDDVKVPREHGRQVVLKPDMDLEEDLDE